MTPPFIKAQHFASTECLGVKLNSPSSDCLPLSICIHLVLISAEQDVIQQTGRDLWYQGMQRGSSRVEGLQSNSTKSKWQQWTAMEQRKTQLTSKNKNKLLHNSPPYWLNTTFVFKAGIFQQLLLVIFQKKDVFGTVDMKVASDEMSHHL